MALIQNAETGKVVGVFIHDPDSGRAMLKTRPSDSSLMQIFALWRDRSMIEEIIDTVHNKRLTRRVRVLPTSAYYGKVLMDRVVKRPYRVKSWSQVTTNHLDSALDQAYTGYVDISSKKQKNPEPSEPVA